MIRRDFIKTAGAVLASTAFPAPSMRADGQLAHGRTILPINRNWRYHPAKVSGAESPEFDDAKFERVVIPHTNIELPWHNFDDKDYEFISTYRRRFKFPGEAEGKRVFVDFEGVMTASTVWINGVLLAQLSRRIYSFLFRTDEASAQGCAKMFWWFKSTRLSAPISLLSVTRSIT